MLVAPSEPARPVSGFAPTTHSLQIERDWVAAWWRPARERARPRLASYRLPVLVARDREEELARREVGPVRCDDDAIRAHVVAGAAREAGRRGALAVRDPRDECAAADRCDRGGLRSSAAEGIRPVDAAEPPRGGRVCCEHDPLARVEACARRASVKLRLPASAFGMPASSRLVQASPTLPPSAAVVAPSSVAPESDAVGPAPDDESLPPNALHAAMASPGSASNIRRATIGDGYHAYAFSPARRTSRPTSPIGRPS